MHFSLDFKNIIAVVAHTLKITDSMGIIIKPHWVWNVQINWADFNKIRFKLVLIIIKPFLVSLDCFVLFVAVAFYKLYALQYICLRKSSHFVALILNLIKSKSRIDKKTFLNKTVFVFLFFLVIFAVFDKNTHKFFKLLAEREKNYCWKDIEKRMDNRNSSRWNIIVKER